MDNQTLFSWPNEDLMYVTCDRFIASHKSSDLLVLACGCVIETHTVLSIERHVNRAQVDAFMIVVYLELLWMFAFIRQLGRLNVLV